MNCVKACLLSLLLLIALTVRAEDVMTIESTITGSQEQPNILVIIPWQSPEQAQDISESMQQKRQQNPFLQPLERNAFVTRNRLLQQLQQDNKP